VRGRRFDSQASTSSLSTSKGRMGAPDLSDQRSYRGTASRARARGPDLLLTRRCRRSPEHHR
jgi:hypothetical protein